MKEKKKIEQVSRRETQITNEQAGREERRGRDPSHTGV